MTENALINPDLFAKTLFEKIRILNPAAAEMERYEFCYALDNLVPEGGWGSVVLDSKEEIEQQVNDRAFYLSIQLKPRRGNRLVLDDTVLRLNQMLFVGLVTGLYPLDWVNRHFYFDLRGFCFYHRTEYFNSENMKRFGGQPYREFTARQKNFDSLQAVGYKVFKEANAEVDECFTGFIQKLIARKGTPILIAIAGQTAAGKTEIVERFTEIFQASGRTVTSLEMDNFLTDRDYREERGIDSLGKDALHFEIFKKCLLDLIHHQKTSTPRYDFVLATSSHDLDGNLKPGCSPLEIEPADIIFIEGNFPFLIPEIAQLIGIKVLYLTDDPIRMKRKWRRDMDYRKKYELMYFLNRYFKEQFLMAEEAYLPQMKTCDLVVDTTGARIWVTPETAQTLET